MYEMFVAVMVVAGGGAEPPAIVGQVPAIRGNVNPPPIRNVTVKTVPGVTVPQSFRVRPGFNTIPVITAQRAVTVVTLPTYNRVVARPVGLTYTVAPATVRFGSTSGGCSSGNCSAPQRFR